MEALRNNIISIYGEKGKNWLASLPEQVKQLENFWNLSQLKPFSNLSYNYVLSGFQNKIPIILKLSLNTEDLDREAKALNAFKRYGAVSILGQQKNALLLEQAVPGQPLKGSISKKETIPIACQVVERLRLAPLPLEADFPCIEDWLSTLDKEWKLPKEHLERARRLKNQLLLENITSPVLLHGDLHQDNILLHGNEWLVIDPKGVIGYPINEIWACVEEPQYDLRFLAEYFNYSLEEVVKWYYVHLILAACWQAEDHLDPTSFLILAETVISEMKKEF
jgi:streptomycin 6-kinase